MRLSLTNTSCRTPPCVELQDSPVRSGEPLPGLGKPA